MKTARVGRQLGEYQFVELGGAGGFSVVWKARRISDDQLVALKLPRVAAFTEHLRQEANLMQQVDDPQVLNLLAANLDHDPPHLVMPWIEGSNLPLPQEVPPPREQVVALERMLELVRVVARLHDQGLVHGDLKPGNVRVDGEGKIWLLDFGLARLQVQTKQERSLALSLVSVDGQSIAGTLDFMAPELLSGQQPTPASDVYSLGVILHRLLVGTPPAFGVSPSSLNPYLPPGCDLFIGHLLQQALEQRLCSAAELIEPLEYFVAEERRWGMIRNGHERRRKAIVQRARIRRLLRGLFWLSLPLIGALLALYYWRSLTLLGGLFRLLVVVVMTPLVLLGVPRINIWIIRGVEERRQRRLEARRRRRWLARGG